MLLHKDTIKLDFTYCPDDDEYCYFRSSITVILDENSDIAKLIAKEKRVLSSNGETGFKNSYIMNPGELLLTLLESTVLLFVVRDLKTDGFGMLLLSCYETQNSIVWTTANIPKPRYFPLNISFGVDDFPEIFPTVHFEFDKKQYYQELNDFVDKMLDSPNCNKDYVIPVVNFLMLKK